MKESIAVIEEAPLSAVAISYFAGGTREEIVRETGIEPRHVDHHVDRLEAVIFLLAAERSPPLMARSLGWPREEVQSYLRQTERHLGRWRQTVQAQELVRERQLEGAGEWFALDPPEEASPVEADLSTRQRSLSVLDFWTARW